MEKELCERGDFFRTNELLASVERFLEHFTDHAAESFDMDRGRRTTGGDMAATFATRCAQRAARRRSSSSAEHDRREDVQIVPGY